MYIHKCIYIYIYKNISEVGGSVATGTSFRFVRQSMFGCEEESICKKDAGAFSLFPFWPREVYVEFMNFSIELVFRN